MMKVSILITLLWASASFPAIPDTPGWYSIPNTKLQTVDACFNGYSYACGNTTGGIYSWSGGVFDTRRNRLLIHGGGHADYRGNEFYALSLDALTLTRINVPGSPTASGCAEAIANGTQANSRHTYDGISYMENVDKMYVFSGSLACGSGNYGTWTWTFDFTTMAWTHVTPSGTGPNGAFGICSAYDPNTGRVFVNDLGYLYAYDPVANTYAKFTGSYKYGIDYHMCSVIDPKRKKFIMLGGGQAWVFNIAAGSNYACSTLTTTGGSAVSSAGYPGLAYDPVRDRIVAWVGGNTVYTLNMDTRAWTAVSSYTGGPGSANGTGTYKRWSYVPALDCFVLNNTYNQNSFTFRFPGSAVERKAPVAAEPALFSGADVYNLRGQKIRTLEAVAGNTPALKGLPTGVYLLRAKGGTGRAARAVFVSQ